MARVTIVPEDKLVMVEGEALFFDFKAPENLHAIQWYDTHGEMEIKGEANKLLKEADYSKYVKPYVQLYEAEKARLEKERAEAEAKRLAEYNSEEARFARLRTARNKRIADTDYLLTADYPIAPESLEDVKEYRQALRDLTSQDGAPWDDETIPWPTMPEVKKVAA